MDIYKEPESDLASHGEKFLAKPRDLPISEWLLSFEGRLNRKQFWMFYFPYIIFILFSGKVLPDSYRFVILVMLLWPAMAVQTKRWHDLDKTGAWCMAWFVPIVGWLVVILDAGLFRGSKLNNMYGESLYKNV